VVFRPDAEITVGSVEQSNTALVYDRQAFLKLFRRIEPGVHPDVEMTRFLTQDAAFPHVPTLFGVVILSPSTSLGVDSAKDQLSPSHKQVLRFAQDDILCGMMQEYVAGSRDAWSYVI